MAYKKLNLYLKKRKEGSREGERERGRREKERGREEEREGGKLERKTSSFLARKQTVLNLS